MALAIASGALAWTMQTEKSALGPIGLVLAVWLVGGAAMDLWQRTGRGKLANRFMRLWRLTRADWGRAVAHAGLGITMFGITGMLAWETEDIRVAQIGESFDVSGYTFTLDSVETGQGPNYLTTMADMLVSRNGREVTRLHPEKRSYPVAQMPTTEAGIDSGVFRDIYLVIGDQQNDGGWAVRTYIKPFANWIWAGAIIMALGGFISLSDRRYRVAAGARRQRQGQGVPAE